MSAPSPFAIACAAGLRPSTAQAAVFPMKIGESYQTLDIDDRKDVRPMKPKQTEPEELRARSSAPLGSPFWTMSKNSRRARKVNVRVEGG